MTNIDKNRRWCRSPPPPPPPPPPLPGRTTIKDLRRRRPPPLLAAAIVAVAASSASHLLLARRASSSIASIESSVLGGERTTHLAPLVRRVRDDDNDNDRDESSSSSSSGWGGEDDDEYGEGGGRTPTRIVVVGEAGGAGDADADAVLDVLRDAFGAAGVDATTLIRPRDSTTRLDPPTGDVASIGDAVWVVVVRSPCDWADGLIRLRGEECEGRGGGSMDNVEADEGGKEKGRESRCAGREFASGADYYRMPWYDDDDDIARDGGGGGNGDETANNHTDDATMMILPRRYDDVFEMRQRKLLLLKHAMEGMPRRVKIIRLSEFDLNSDVLVRDLSREYGLAISETYVPHPPRVDPMMSSSRIDDVFACVEFEKWKEAMQRIDWSLEGYFGHNRLDCHLCRGGGGVADDGGGRWRASTKDGMPIVAPTSVYVLGERNSGTTFVSSTLAAAFDPPNEMGSMLERFSIDVPVLLHKHMFRHDPLDMRELGEIKAREDILWIMVVRSPCDW